jgi:hypothetical protein
MREYLKKHPWLGWVVAAVCLLGSGVVLFRTTTAETPLDRLSENVTIRCTETGQEWTMRRGSFERLLMSHPGALDPGKGIPSEFAEGRLTGVLVDKDDSTRKRPTDRSRINAMKKAYQD